MQLHQMSNGIRLLHSRDNSQIVYCGFAINAASRDEFEDEHGLAHLIEHMLFKGTLSRNNFEIIEFLENVGGEINAFTTKEETYVYAIVPKKYVEMAVELLSDIVFNSQFPEQEIKKEKKVIGDEIELYNDSPSELIFDDFENIILRKSSLGHNILGTKKSLRNIDRKKCLEYVRQCYTGDNILFFASGHIDESRVVELASRYFPSQLPGISRNRTKSNIIEGQHIETKKRSSQTHCLIGIKAYPLFHENQKELALINNILGGPIMSSILNIALREKRGLVYSVESSVVSYSDVGFFTTYFSCSKSNYERCKQIVFNELESFFEKPLTPRMLKVSKQQLCGQLLISYQNKENLILAATKNALHLNSTMSIGSVIGKIKSVSRESLQAVAKDLFIKENYSVLSYV